MNRTELIEKVLFANYSEILTGGEILEHGKVSLPLMQVEAFYII